MGGAERSLERGQSGPRSLDSREAPVPASCDLVFQSARVEPEGRAGALQGRLPNPLVLRKSASEQSLRPDPDAVPGTERLAAVRPPVSGQRTPPRFCTPPLWVGTTAL